MTYIIQKLEWYLSYQDGAATNERFDTEKEAKLALKKLGREGGRGICITSRITPIYNVEKIT